MSKYTLEVREILNLGHDIFDFDYPLFDESYRKTFQKHFIHHFYFREIGSETIGRFKFYLREKLNSIMPYYNKLFEAQNTKIDIASNYDVTEKFSRVTENTQNQTSDTSSDASMSDTPLTRTSISDTDYISSLNKASSRNKSNATGQGNESWERTMKGNIGVETSSDIRVKYEKSIRNIELEIFNELEILFMGIF